jgi:O-antigen/teichoic acid export membrane protein
MVRMITQTLIVGMSIRYLGAEDYGIWLTAVAALGWLSWGQAGLAPGLVNALAAAEGEGRRADQGVYFSTALAVLMAIILALLLAGQAVIHWGGPWFGDLLAPDAGGKAGSGHWATFLQVAFALALLRIPLGLVESAFVGLQSIHVLRLFDMAGQVLCVAAAFALALGSSPKALFLLGIGLATECGVLAAGFYLVTRLRPELMPSLSKVKLRASGRMFDLSFGYLIIQVTGYLVAHAGTLILAGNKGAVAVPVFALTWQLYQMAAGIWMMVMTGLWGALGEAQAKGDWSWIRKAAHRLIIGAMALSVAFSLMLAIAGNWILSLWSGGKVTGDPLFFAVMAAYCIVFTWAVLHAQVLSALNLVWKQMPASVVNGVLVVILALILVPLFGVTGLVSALLGACLLSTAWFYPVMLSKVLGRKNHVPA